MLKCGLYIVATPIGNLKDITERALEVLRGADVIACEDTRVARKLFSLLELPLNKTFICYEDHNEEIKAPDIAELVQSGQSVALISDAGSPLISDPGYKLVRYCRENGVPLWVVPGASAVISALQLSGLPTNRFMFAGFIPNKDKARKDLFEELKTVNTTLIFYETAPRLVKTLQSSVEVFGTRQAAVAREITKIYEECRTGTCAELAAYYTDQDSLDTALDLLKKAVAFENEYNIPHDLSTDLAIGDIYRKLNETDSAYNYLSQAIKSENIYTKRSAYHALYYLFLQKGEAKEAIHFNEKYKACLREIKEMGSSSEIQQAKEQFELGKRIQEKEKNKTERGVIVLLFLSILSYVLWIWNIRKEQEKDEILQEKTKMEIRDQQREETLRDVLHENKNLKESLGTSKKETKQWKTKYRAKENEMQRDLEAYGEEMEDQLLELPLKTAQLLEELNLKPRALTDREILMIQSCVQCYHPNCWSYLRKYANLQKDDLLVCCLIRLGFTDTEKMLLLFPNPKDDNSGDMYSNEKYTKAALDKRIYRIRRERLGKILNSYKKLVLFLQGL